MKAKLVTLFVLIKSEKNLVWIGKHDDILFICLLTNASSHLIIVIHYYWIFFLWKNQAQLSRVWVRIRFRVRVDWTY